MTIALLTLGAVIVAIAVACLAQRLENKANLRRLQRKQKAVRRAMGITEPKPPRIPFRK